MKPIFRMITISTISIAIAGSFPLFAQARVSEARVAPNIGHSNEIIQREERPERNLNSESMNRFARDRDNDRQYSFDNKRIDAEKMSSGMKSFSREGKEQRNLGNLDNPTNFEQKERIKNASEIVPLNAQQERAQYVQDLNWQSVRPNVKPIVATTNINNSNKAVVNQQKQSLNSKNDNISMNKIHTKIETQRYDIDKISKDMQNKLNDRNKFHTNQNLRDPYRESLIQRIWGDIRRSFRDVRESKLHPYEIEKYRAILERDLHDLIRDKMELEQYDSRRPMTRSTTQARKKA